MMDDILEKDSVDIRIISVTGEWDIIKPYSDTDLVDYFNYLKKADGRIRIVLCHPFLRGLEEHCKNEENQELIRMREKIIRNTNRLIHLNETSVVQVKWHSHQPAIHIVGNENEAHFGYYPKRAMGHYSRRYVVKKTDPFFRSLDVQFENIWNEALYAPDEIPWVTNRTSIDKAVFLDRDDTLIRDIGYSDPGGDKVEILDGVVDGLKLLQESNFRLIVVSNQQSVGYGAKSHNGLAEQTKKMIDVFKEHGVLFDKFYYCEHLNSENCNCRKPKPGMFYKAVTDFHLDISKCYFIGNSDSDRDVGRNIGELKIFIVKKPGDFLKIVKDEIL